MEKRGFGSRPACTRSASEMPSSKKDACSPLLLSKAICTASSTLNGFCSSSATRWSMLFWSSLLRTHFTSLSMRSLAVFSTGLKPPSEEKLAQPARNRVASKAAVVLRVSVVVISLLRVACHDQRADRLGRLFRHWPYHDHCAQRIHRIR